MINNQFAIVPTDLAKCKAELTTIHFLDEKNTKLSAKALLQDLLAKAMVNETTVAAKKAAFDSLMATPELTATEFFASNAAVSAPVFYLLGLQLLGFQTPEDFALADPLAAMHKIQLATVHTDKDQWDRDTLIEAWYLLLNTHTSFGQPYLESLANLGYLDQFNDLPKPLIFNGKAQPVFATNRLIRDVVYVESDLDTDHDGHCDLLRAEVIRPSETETGLKVPVILTASPYDQGTNDAAGAALTHDVSGAIQHKHPNQNTYADVQFHPVKTATPSKHAGNGKTVKQAEEHFQRDWGYTLNNYFLARGFAVVYAAGIGTKHSDGLRTTGDDAETKSTTAIIEWLAGNRRAFTTRAGETAIEAWWSNRQIAMSGRSYLGTLQIAAATTGVAGLKTCIVEAAISSWYDYYRENGLVVAPGGFQGEDADVLALETFSRKQQAGDYHRIKDRWQHQLEALTTGQDRASGDYNQFWDARNYLKAADKIKANMVLVHGLNDWNVKPSNAYNLYQHLTKLPITTKVFLHQGQHIYINNFQSLDFTDMMNLWLTNQLLGVDNGAATLIPPVTVQDNVTPQTWHKLDQWGSDAKWQQMDLADANQFAERPATPTFTDQLSKAQLATYTANEASGRYDQWLADLLQRTDSPIEATRLAFVTKPLAETLTISGRPAVDLSVASDNSVGLLTCMLVDYGSAKRFNESPSVLAPDAISAGFEWKRDTLKEFKLADTPSDFKVISFGHINMQNRHHSYQADELIPNTKYAIHLQLQPTHYVLPKGRQLGLVICGTDVSMTTRGTMGVQYRVDPAASKLNVPSRPTLN